MHPTTNMSNHSILSTKYFKEQLNPLQDEPQGKSVIKFENGNEYEGDFVDGKGCGKGIYKFANGDEYEGDFVDGKRLGIGIYKFANGDEYEGEFLDGKGHGKGIYKFANGDEYKGDFENGKIHGKGILKRANGDEYEGDFVDGKMQGKGIYIYTNEDEYKGEFLDGKEHGKGILKRANGDEYKGDFVDGKMQGKGILKRPNGDEYEGEFTDGKMQGKGIYKFANGCVYEGEFLDGKEHGKGILKRANGDEYKGDFVDGKMHGKGFLKRANGEECEGEFVKGIMLGKGVIKYPNGNVYKGGVLDNEFQGKGTLFFKNGSIVEWTDEVYKVTYPDGKQILINANDETIKEENLLLFVEILTFRNNSNNSLLELYKTLLNKNTNNLELIKSLFSVFKENDDFEEFSEIADFFLNLKITNTLELTRNLKLREEYFYANNRGATIGLLKYLKSRLLTNFLKNKKTWARDVARFKKEMEGESQVVSKTKKKTISRSLEHRVADNKEKKQSTETTISSATPKTVKQKKKRKPVEPVATSSNVINIPDVREIIKTIDDKVLFEEFLICKKDDFATYRVELKSRLERLSDQDVLTFCGDVFNTGLEFIRLGKFKRARLTAEILSLRKNDFTNMLAEKVIETVLQSEKIDKLSTARKSLKLVLDQEKYSQLIEGAKPSKRTADSKRASFASQRRATLIDIKKPVDSILKGRDLLRRNSISDFVESKGQGHHPLTDPELIRTYKARIENNDELRGALDSYKALKEQLVKFKMTMLRKRGSHETWGYDGFDFLGSFTLTTSLHTKELGLKILAEALCLKERKDQEDLKLS